MGTLHGPPLPPPHITAPFFPAVSELEHPESHARSRSQATTKHTPPAQTHETMSQTPRLFLTASPQPTSQPHKQETLFSKDGYCSKTATQVDSLEYGKRKPEIQAWVQVV